MRIEPLSKMVLYVWDYFYVSNAPRKGDEESWRTIERATCRIHDSHAYLLPPWAADVRMHHARRVRSAVRTARREIAKLSAAPEAWVSEALELLEVFTDELIQDLGDEAERVVLD